MLVIKVLTISLSLFLTVAFLMHLKGFKKEALLIRQGIYGFALIYISMFLMAIGG